MKSLERRVGYSAIYKDNKMKIGAVIDYMQDCEWFQIDSEKELRKFFNDNNYGVYIVYRQVDILRIPEYAEDITVKTWIYETSKIHGERNTVIIDEKGEPCVISYGYGPFMDLSKGRPTKLPDEILNTFLIE